MNRYDSSAATMLADDTMRPAHRLVLQSHLDEFAKLWPWVDALGAEYSIPARTLFTIHLCLEEAVSNIIRHGYEGREGQPIMVNFARESEIDLVFTIDDQAPPFDPLAYDPGPHARSSMDLLEPGDQGIRLLRKYSAGLGYGRLAHGNRLTIRFSTGG
jgi:serine/threonine-protein kinase RsbW